MSPDTVASSETTLLFPSFVGIAMGKLPKFLKAINAELAAVDHIRFSPSTWTELKEPPAAEVVFELKGNSSITFHLVARTVDDGPPVGYLRLDRIVHRVGFGGTRKDILHEFEYLHHHCGCGYCEGPEYPFLPKGIGKGWFEKSLTPERRLHQIRKFVGRLNI